MTVSVSDVVRTAYLAAMGVPQFRARRLLPGAAPSRPPAVVVDETPAASARRTSAPDPRSETSPASVQAVTDAIVSRRSEPLDQSRAAPLPTAAAAPAVPLPAPVMPAAPAADAEPLPRFCCQLYRVAEGHWALVDLDDHPALEGPERQLWQAVQRAMNWQAEAVASAFVWPRAVTPGTLFLAPDAESARTVMSSWLQRDVPAGERLWLLGEQLTAFVDRPHRAVPALTACLRDPVRKRLLWQHLSRGD